MSRRPRGTTTSAVLAHIEKAEKEGREWSLGTIAEAVKIHRTYAQTCLLRLQAQGKLVTGAQRFVRQGLVVARPEASGSQQEA